MTKKNKKKYPVIATAIVLIVMTVVWLFFPKGTEAAWFDDSYGYRQKVTFGNSGGADSNKKVKFDVDTATLITNGKLQSDCDDIRFTDQNGKLLPHYLDSAGGACNSASTDFYVVVPSINSGDTAIYMYYGNSSSTSISGNQFTQSTFSPTSGPSFVSEEKGQTPVLYWKFDEGYGTKANDSSPLGNYGTLGAGSTAPTWQSEDMCISGKCLKFNGSSTDVSRAFSSDTELTPGTGSVTVSSWFKHVTTISGTEVIVQRKLVAGRGAEIGYTLYMDNSGHACAIIEDDTFGEQNICTTAAYNDNTWHFIEFVKTTTTNITLYLDGEKAVEDSTILVNDAMVDADVYVGSDGPTASSYWNGFIDEVKIYNYAKTAAQVKTDYTNKGSADQVSAVLGTNIEKTALSNGLRGYWNMDESSWTNDCSTGSVLDLTGNGYNGTACPASTGPTGGNQGKFGFDGLFDGSDDYIEATPSKTDRSFVSIGGWVNFDDADNVNNVDKYHHLFGWTSEFYIKFRSYTSEPGAGYFLWLSGTTENGGTGNLGFTYFIPSKLSGWHHIMGTYDGQKAKLYVDGSMVQEQSLVDTGIKNNNRNFRIGGDDEEGYYFDGKIDDVRLYYRALSDNEVRSLYEWTPGPKGWWKLDEKSGTTANDSSGNGYTGTLTNGPVWSNGKVGGALTFDNNDDYVTMGDNLDLSTKNFTLMAWARREDQSSGDVIVAKKNGGGSGNSGYAIYCTTNSTCTAYLADGSAEFTVSGSMGSAQEWHFVAVVVDRSGNSATKFYSDGVETTTSRSGTISSLGSVGTTASLRIGRYSNSTFPFNGQIDNVKIFDYAMTPKQIVSEMNSGHPAVGSPVASAIGHWKFDEGYGTTANNSGSAVSAIAGSLGTGNSAPTWTTSGKFGKALTFDGTSDYISMGTDASLNIIGQNLSFTAWVKRSTSTKQGVLVGRGTAGASGYAFGIGNIQGSGCTTHQIAIGKFGVTWKCIDSFPADTNWHHLVVALDSSGERAYIDGVLMGSNTDTGSIATSSNNFRVGIGTDGASLFGGTLDEIKMYNYALNADQVKTEFNQGKVQVFGALSTASDGVTADNSSEREYCVPGDAGSCSYPVHLWSFDEGSSTTGNDIGSSPLSATLANGVTWASGKIGKGLSFDGCSGCNQDDSVSVSSLTLPTIMTLEAWIYPKTTGEGGLGRIIDNTSDITWFVNSSNANRMEFSAIWSTANGNWYATPSFTYNQWNHVAVVYDYGSTSNTPTFYVNGIKQTTNVGSGSPSGTHSLSAHTFYIGNNSTGARTWDGFIDQVKMYDYARTASQIAWDYNRGGPVGWWKFDECQGTTAYDASGNSYNGTITPGNNTGDNDTAGTCSSGVTTEMWNDGTTGKYNSSLDFDGTNDEVDIGDKDILNAISISTWVNWDAVTTNDGIISKRTGTEVAGDWALRMSDNGDGKLEWMVWSGVDSSKNVYSNNAISTGAWHHVTVTFDSSTNTTKIYIDGKLDVTDTTVTNDLANTAESIAIGYAGQSGSEYFDGRIDDVRVYNYVLTSPQINSIMNENAAIRFGPQSGSP